MKIIKFIMDNKDRTIDSVKKIKYYPLESLGQLLPIGMVMISAFGFIFAFISFLLEHGFSKQINSITDGITGTFTYGTWDMMVSGAIFKLITIVLLAEFIVMLISYIKKESKTKRILACTCLGIAFVLGSFTLTVFQSEKLSYDMQLQLAKVMTVFNGMKTDTVIGILKFIALLGIVASIIFIVLMFLSECRWMIKHGALAFGISYIGLPLLLLLIENIIPLIVMICLIIMIGGALMLTGKLAFSSEKMPPSKASAPHSKQSEKQMASISTVKNNPKQKEINGWHAPFWRDKGSTTTFAHSQEDHIYCYDIWHKPTPVCGVSEFEKGKVVIIDSKTKTRVMNVAGCKAPQR